MGITIKIKGDKKTNFKQLGIIAEEFLGIAEMEENNPYTMIVSFYNDVDAKKYSECIEPYLAYLIGKKEKKSSKKKA